jgi:hypothetical protein
LKPDSLYTLPETIIHKEKPFVWISNFSNLPLTIASGQFLGYLVDPNQVYSTINQISLEQTSKLVQYANFVQQRLSDNTTFYLQLASKEQDYKVEEEEIRLPENQPVEGGPKTSETLPDKMEQRNF